MQITTQNGGVHGVLTLVKLPITFDEPPKSVSSSGQVPKHKEKRRQLATSAVTFYNLS